jgi:protein-S-isoprenylcysteine O-methyltransferase Ste14
MKTIVVFSLLFGAASAFVQPHPAAAVRRVTLTSIQESSKKENGGMSMPDLDFSGAKEMLAKGMLYQALDVDSIKANLQAAVKNSASGEFGTRGEAYFVAQAALVVCIALGGIPYVSGFANFVLGPGLLLIGLATIVISFQDLGTSLSPWPTPPDDGSLKTEGIYAQCRHPMYAGLLATLLGLSVLTDSADRLLLTGLLWYVLDVKTDKEEEGLQEMYSDYSNYMVRDENV